MKGMKNDGRLSPGNSKQKVAKGMSTFTPHIDRQAKWHKRFDDMMADGPHKRKMAKVTLPKYTFRPASEEEET